MAFIFQKIVIPVCIINNKTAILYYFFYIGRNKFLNQIVLTLFYILISFIKDIANKTQFY